jgi:MFS family permease
VTSDIAQPLTKRGVPIDPTLRVLALGTLVNRAGAGALVTTFALFFTREVHFHATQVGAALSVGALAGLLVVVPGGHLGDIRGPREVLWQSTVLSGVVTLPLLVTRQLWALIIVMALVNGSNAVANSVRSGYVARVAVGGQGVRFKAYLRAVTNVAMGAGALFGGLALWINEPWAYLATFALDAITSIWAGLLFLRLPHLEPAPARAAGEPRLAVMRDAPFVVVTLLSGILAMHFMVMEIGIPLWISEHTHAPTSMVAILLVLNTAVVAMFQVRLSQGADTVLSSAHSVLRGGFWIAAGFVIIGFSDGPGATGAVILLIVGASVHVVGEMITSGGQWGVAMGLAPMERQGQYQGFNALGFGLAGVVAPSLIAALCISWGRPGWFVFGGLILASTAALEPTCRWALATREKYGAATASG